jgi:hypothetical protein
MEFVQGKSKLPKEAGTHRKNDVEQGDIYGALAKMYKVRIGKVQVPQRSRRSGNLHPLPALCPSF